MIIYMATNKITGKCYVGQTVRTLEKRKRQHISNALSKQNDMYISRAIRKYGPDNFDWEILHDDITDIEFLNRLEIYYIGYYDTFENGYNLTLGGGGTVGWIPSEESRKRMSEAQKRRKRKPHTEKTKRRISESHKGMKHSEKSKKKLSELQKGKNNVNYGKKMPDAQKKKISKAMKGKYIGKYVGKDSPRAVAIIIGNGHFDTLNDAAEFVGMTPTAIRYRILHKTKWMDYNYVN